MPASLARAVSAAILVAACAAACQGVIAGPGTTASSTASSSSGTGAGGAASGGTSSASTSASTSASSSGGGSCTLTTCNIDADCQVICPPPATGTIYCCDMFTSLCYLQPTDTDDCVQACVAGGECPPGVTCTPAAECPLPCTCDATGHYACAQPQTQQCPSPHATCGDPCDPFQNLACMCASSPGSASLLPCDCNADTNVWTCSTTGWCPPDGVVAGSTCADYPVGSLCNVGCGQCSCTMCESPAWYCF